MTRDAERLGVRHKVTVDGPPDAPVSMFGHGYATNQDVWRHVAPAFARDYRCVRFDYTVEPDDPSDRAEPERYQTLYGYAEDVIDLIEAFALAPVTFVGHSASAMIGVLACALRPSLFSKLVLVGESARFINDEGYIGGFTAEQASSLVEQVEHDFAGWATAMAPGLVGDGSPAVAGELRDLMTASTANSALLARSFMLGDYRSRLHQVAVPTLVMQPARDPLVPTEVGRFLESQLPDSQFVQLAATGHFPILSAPAEVIGAIQGFLDDA